MTKGRRRPPLSKALPGLSDCRRRDFLAFYLGLAAKTVRGALRLSGVSSAPRLFRRLKLHYLYKTTTISLGGELDLAGRLETMHKEEKAKAPANLRKGVTTTSDAKPLADHAG